MKTTKMCKCICTCQFFFFRFFIRFFYEIVYVNGNGCLKLITFVHLTIWRKEKLFLLQEEQKRILTV